MTKDPNPVASIAELEESVTLEEIDSLLNRVVGTEGGIIIQRFKPQPGWLWKQWYGTVLYHASSMALKNMAWALIFCIGTRIITHGDFNVMQIPTNDHPFISRLKLVEHIWKTLMGLTTFLLTFFVGQAYSFWRSVLDQGRGIQGRLNDISMLLATHATRRSSSNQCYTYEASQFLDCMAHKLRVFHLLFWATNTKRFRVLLTEKGMDRMVSQGYLPLAEKERLDQLDVPPTQKLWAVYESAIMASQEALHNKKIIKNGSDSLELVLLEQFLRLRSVCATIPDLVDGRMPLAYAHFVQILVDAFLVTAPIAQ
jgi:hypothetical protein